MIAYLVTGGTYSDYHVAAVFSTRASAKVFIKGLGDDMQIEEWPIDMPPDKWAEMHIVMDRAGNVIRAEVSKPSVLRDEPGNHFFYVLSEWGRLQGEKGDILFSTVVRTDDKERAIKVANERRTMILTHGLWGKSGVARLWLGGGEELVLNRG